MAITVPRDPEAWAKLGRTIRECREEDGLSRRALAEKAGVSEKSIQVAEEGRVPRGRMPQSLARIEEALRWLPGAHISILNGGSWARTGPIEEVKVELEPEGAAEVRAEANRLEAKWASANPRDIELTQSGHLAQDVFMRQAKRYRKLQDVSLDELAKGVASLAADLGVDLAVEDLRRLEDGTRLLRMAEARGIAQALGTTVDWLLRSGFSDDAPEEMRWPPDDKEMEAEANAVLRRMADVGAQLNAAHQQAANARDREAHARAEADMAAAMVQSVTARQREMEKHYQYLLGRIDSVRAARGEATVMQPVSLFEDDELSGEEEAPLRSAHTDSGSKAGAPYRRKRTKEQQEEDVRRAAKRLGY